MNLVSKTNVDNNIKDTKEEKKKEFDVFKKALCLL